MLSEGEKTECNNSGRKQIHRQFSSWIETQSATNGNEGKDKFRLKFRHLWKTMTDDNRKLEYDIKGQITLILRFYWFKANNFEAMKEKECFNIS